MGSRSRALVAVLAVVAADTAAAQALAARVSPLSAGESVDNAPLADAGELRTSVRSAARRSELLVAAASDGSVSAVDSVPPASARSTPALRYKDPPPAPWAPWRGSAGRWSTGIGLALLAGGATVAMLNQKLSDDLEDRYHLSALSSSDAAKYDRVRLYNVLSTAMLVTGGTAASVGVVLWSTAPEIRPTRGGATFGVQGRF